MNTTTSYSYNETQVMNSNAVSIAEISDDEIAPETTPPEVQQADTEECPICLSTYPLEEVLKCSNGHTSACGYCLSKVVTDTCSICRVPTMTVEEDEEEDEEQIILQPSYNQLRTDVLQTTYQLRMLPEYLITTIFVAVRKTTISNSEYARRYEQVLLFRAEYTRSGSSVRLRANHSYIQGRRRSDGRTIGGVAPLTVPYSLTVRLTTLRDIPSFRAALRRNNLNCYQDIMYNPFQAGQ